MKFRITTLLSLMTLTVFSQNSPVPPNPPTEKDSPIIEFGHAAETREVEPLLDSSICQKEYPTGVTETTKWYIVRDEKGRRTEVTNYIYLNFDNEPASGSKTLRFYSENDVPYSRIEQRLDVTNNQFINELKYDRTRKNGDYSQWTYHSWNDEEMVWNDSFEVNYLYDLNGRRNTIFTRKRNKETDLFENEYRWFYLFDENGRETSEIIDRWSSENKGWMKDWQNGWRTVPGETVHDTLKGTVTQYWNKDKNSFVNSVNKFEETIDGIEYSLTRNWSTIRENWVNDSRSFSVEAECDTTTRQIWDSSLSLWENSTKMFSCTNGDTTINTTLDWFPELNKWTNDRRFISWRKAFDNSGTTIQFGGAFSDSWSNWSQSVAYYDSDGNVIAIYDRHWDDNEWIDLSIREFTRYDHGRIKTSSLKRWDNQTGAQDECETCEYFYSVWEEEESPVNNNEFECLLPNPYLAGNAIYCCPLSEEDIENLDIFLFNQSGQVVYKTGFPWNKTFGFPAHLPTGFYVFAIMNQQELVYKRKLIIKSF